MLRVALDATGAPEALATAAARAVADDPRLHVILVGDRERLGPPASDRVEVFHCTQTVATEADPVAELRTKPDASVSRCWQLVAERRADAVLSAGPPAAVVAAGLRLRRFLRNVSQPAVAAPLPAPRGPCLLLDVGAGSPPLPEHLRRFGLMGSLFARNVLGRSESGVGILSLDSPDSPDEALNDLPKIEGDALLRGDAEVVVCGGRTGAFVVRLLEAVLSASGRADEYASEEYGVRPLLGLDAIGLLCRDTNEATLRAAFGQAARWAETKLNDRIEHELRLA